MTDEAGVTYTSLERRLHARHRAKTKIVIIANGKRTKCQATNLSASGVAVQPTDPMTGLGLKVGSKAELTFVIQLADVARLHRRLGKVAYVNNGVTGFSMEPFGVK